MSFGQVSDEDLIRLCDARRLIPLPLSTPLATPARKLFLTTDLMHALRAPAELDVDEVRLAKLVADLQSMAEGMNVAIPGFLKPLGGGRDGVWEVRQRRPRPAVRVFTLFARRDLLVLTHAIKRQSLDGKGDPQWAREIRRARFMWGQLFDGSAPLRGGWISDYLSGGYFLSTDGTIRYGDAPLAALDRS